MELLIPGLILVALMVYASTRIKKNAALAFEPESITNEKFSLEKPKGFLSVLNGNPELEFEAYCKEFGEDNAAEIKQARVEVRYFAGADLKTRVAEIKKSSTIASNVSEIIGDQKYLLIEAKKVENGIDLLEFYKIAEVDSGVRELKIITLDETSEEIANGISIMQTSFLVK